ncbi:MAG: hypothetical protein JWQ54_3253 [Mucilaginibacter sp.]|nr:hypothetical protein [Mucilaginibacter sp.]
MNGRVELNSTKAFAKNVAGACHISTNNNLLHIALILFNGIG